MVLHFLLTPNPAAFHTVHNFLDDKDLRLPTMVSCSPLLTLVLYRTMPKKIRNGATLHPLRIPSMVLQLADFSTCHPADTHTHTHTNSVPVPYVSLRCQTYISSVHVLWPRWLSTLV